MICPVVKPCTPVVEIACTCVVNRFGTCSSAVNLLSAAAVSVFIWLVVRACKSVLFKAATALEFMPLSCVLVKACTCAVVKACTWSVVKRLI